MSLKPALGLRYFSNKKNVSQLQSLKKPVFMFPGGYVYIVPDFIRKKYFTYFQKENLKSYFSLPKVIDSEICQASFMEQKRLEEYDRRATERLKSRFYV